jgi:site-specific recombinase XerD
MKLEEAFRLFMLVDRAEKTQAAYERFLGSFVADVGPARPLDLIRPEDLDAFMSDMRRQPAKYADHPKRPTESKPLSTATIYKRTKMLRAFFNWCVERGFLRQSPARFLSARKPPAIGQGKAATEAEVAAIIDAARNKPRDYAIVQLLAQSGCRAGDVVSLQLSRLNLAERYAFVDGKGSKRRKIVFGAEAAAALVDWLEVRPADVAHDYVFTSTRGHGQLSPASVSQLLRRLCKVARLDRSLGAHSFRHYVAMKLARAHVAPTVIQAYLGHSNISTTLGYCTSIDDTDLHDASSVLGGKGGKKQKPASEIVPFPQTG